LGKKQAKRLAKVLILSYISKTMRKSLETRMGVGAQPEKYAVSVSLANVALARA
jgi:hypothetical protein